MEIEFSVQEVISTINHSELPTLVAEGRDDVVVLRRLEDRFSATGLSVFPVGGQRNVLLTFLRKDEIENGKFVFFAADQDRFVYEGIPEEYDSEEVFFTDGYSVENDLYRDGELENLLTVGERAQFKKDLDWFLKWYALVLWRNLQGQDTEFALHPAALVNDAGRYDADCTLGQAEDYPEEFRASLAANYPRLVRGKSLMALLVRHLSAPQRLAKHSKHALLEYGAAANGLFMMRLYGWTQGRLEANGLLAAQE